MPERRDDYRTLVCLSQYLLVGVYVSTTSVMRMGMRYAVCSYADGCWTRQRRSVQGVLVDATLIAYSHTGTGTDTRYRYQNR